MQGSTKQHHEGRISALDVPALAEAFSVRNHIKNFPPFGLVVVVLVVLVAVVVVAVVPVGGWGAIPWGRGVGGRGTGPHIYIYRVLFKIRMYIHDFQIGFLERKLSCCWVFFGKHVGLVELFVLGDGVFLLL